jgi:hypothetical protein
LSTRARDPAENPDALACSTFYVLLKSLRFKEIIAMTQTSTKITPASILHRLLRVTPGSVPNWITACSCEGWSLFIVLEIIFLFVALAAWTRLSPWISLVLIAAIGAFAFLLEMPFEERELFGRARRRRRECVRCGRPDVAAQSPCSTCGNAN